MPSPASETRNCTSRTGFCDVNSTVLASPKICFFSRRPLSESK